MSDNLPEQKTAFSDVAHYCITKAMEGKPLKTTDVQHNSTFSTNSTSYVDLLNLSGKWICGLCQVNPGETTTGYLKATIDGTAIETGLANDRDCIIGPGANWNSSSYWAAAWVCPTFVISESTLVLQGKNAVGSGGFGARTIAMKFEE